MLKLRSSDKEIFKIEDKVIEQSKTIKNMIEDGAATREIPLKVSSQTLAKVLKWCKQHQQKTISDNCNDNKDKLKKEWDDKFSRQLKVETDILHDLLLATDCLDIPTLLECLCKLVEKMVAGKMPKEIRRMFNIKNDFTPADEKEITKE